jgi:hypothetical protein
MPEYSSIVRDITKSIRKIYDFIKDFGDSNGNQKNTSHQIQNAGAHSGRPGKVTN